MKPISMNVGSIVALMLLLTSAVAASFSTDVSDDNYGGSAGGFGFQYKVDANASPVATKAQVQGVVFTVSDHVVVSGGATAHDRALVEAKITGYASWGFAVDLAGGMEAQVWVENYRYTDRTTYWSTALGEVAIWDEDSIFNTQSDAATAEIVNEDTNDSAWSYVHLNQTVSTSDTTLVLRYSAFAHGEAQTDRAEIVVHSSAKMDPAEPFSGTIVLWDFDTFQPLQVTYLH